MASEDDIKSFIEQQREAGAFDSSGNFSVDLRKARQKSELVHQTVAGAHALYWVQAASHLKPISVCISWASLRINGDVPFSWEECQQIALGDGIISTRFRSLRKAIRACVALADEPAQLIYSHATYGSYQLDLSSGRVKSRRPEGFDWVGVDFPRKGSAAQRAVELRVLEARCGFSPILPRYDNRNIADENIDGYLGRLPCTTLWNTYTHPSYLLALRQWQQLPKRTGLLVADESYFSNQIPGKQSDHSVFLLERDRLCHSGRADRVIGIPLGLEGPGFVRLISQGVIVESFEHDLGVPGAWAVACVDHLETDLSGLKLVRNPPFDELLARLKEDTVQLARKALQQLPLFQIPSAAKEVSPGLLVRLMLWAFAPKEERSAEGDGAANSSDCQKEIRRRLGNL